MTGLTTLVTGGNRGIGRELAAQLADRGHAVVLGARSLAAAQAAVDDLLADAPARSVTALTLDVTDRDDVARAARTLDATSGRLDVLVNNAGGFFDYERRSVDADLSVVSEAFATNVVGTWRVVQDMLPLLRRAAAPVIVNVSSEKACLTTMDGTTPAYRASKIALNALTRMLAADLDDDGVAVYGASPGWTATDLGGPAGRPVAEGAASIRWVLEQERSTLRTGHVYQDGRVLPW
ncbi:SDR family NAD(P)-dependent oxidoreductase [Mycolicibacterium sp. P1-18]|uniref:SDR family NAD(P)-dependent oxidoreductase n=1 Tax=Mycolicibacterium sp. P1-18 TaxID=2024615 RepID=UPI0011F0E8C1|nr:SDR family NAD(P)-dependent oxidoreductase [Mycolicibacterium sp. P1-18]KAA0099483.1 SDR family NAD(P)-dependent oxidoreductase [Mycolicibacterium sp. P1-18]